MPTLQFMPWCPIDRTYSAGEITLIRFRQDEAIAELDEPTVKVAWTISSSYRDIEGRPVRNAALVRYEARPLLADLTDQELEITRDCLAIACFCGLANREYFNPLGPYCNADCFNLYGQKFKNNLEFIAVATRRREGRTYDARPLAGIVFSVPAHVAPIPKVSLDAELLKSLVAFRQEQLDGKWPRWQNAIACYNGANTDNDVVRYQVEWGLMAAAFEHLLEAKSDYEDVAQKFTEVVAPSAPLLARDAKRRAEGWRDPDRPMRYEWMKEFYRIRGDFAHGRLRTRQPGVWEPLEHLVLAAVAFPLVVRCLLKKERKYELSRPDLAELEAFEKLADERFLEPPAGQKGSLDSVWSRLRGEAGRVVDVRKAVEELKRGGLFNNWIT